MQLSFKWLKKYVELPGAIEPVDFGRRLTLSTVEVEGVKFLAEDLDNIFTGRVAEVSAHPNADKLKLARVSLGGREMVEVVCGGSNLAAGQMVALAKIGARVRWHGQGELVQLEKTTIRGQESNGMICAADEIGLGELFPHDAGQILDLSQLDLEAGLPLAQALKLDDAIFDIDNKSLTNRPDLWGHYGLAREAAAIYNAVLLPYAAKKIVDGQAVSLAVDVQEPDWCPRYLGVAVDNVKISASPAWLVQALQSVGVRSINNVVDITNYLMLDLGQPMHAFDADLVQDNFITVRRAQAGEKFVTLDDQQLALTADDLVIADAARPIALAGVIGGRDSGITEKTKTIIFEAANFDPISIRKTAARHGLRTEASMRFEKSLDPVNAKIAIEKAVELLLAMCPAAKVASPLIDSFNKKPQPVEIHTSFDFIRNRIGDQVLTDGLIKDLLQRLGFSVKGRSGEIRVGVPTWRATKDVSIPEDLVEEAARLYGYDNLTPQMPAAVMSLAEVNELRELERTIKNILVMSGQAVEMQNYSFVTAEQEAILGITDAKHIVLENSVVAGQNILRTTLLHGLVKNLQDNYREFEQMNIFEIGRVFLPAAGADLINPEKKYTLPRQPLRAAGVVLTGRPDPFFTAKGLLSLVFNRLQLDYSSERAEQLPPYIHPRRALNFTVNDKVVALAGELHPAVLQRLDINQAAGFWQIDLDELIQVYSKQYRYAPVLKFPAIKLDISLVVDEKIQWRQIHDLVKQTAPELIKRVHLFDVFKNDKIGAGKRSLAFRVVYQAADRTLAMEEAREINQRVISRLEKKCQAKARE